MKRLVAFSIFCLLGLGGCLCEFPDGCFGNYTITGKLVDGSGVPATGVGVYLLYPSGNEYIIAMTDINGEFVESRNAYYSRISEASLVYRKIGYADFITEPLGYGDGTCGDQVVVRDAVMTP